MWRSMDVLRHESVWRLRLYADIYSFDTLK